LFFLFDEVIWIENQVLLIKNNPFKKTGTALTKDAPVL
jgi:hypothetical protein